MEETSGFSEKSTPKPVFVVNNEFLESFKNPPVYQSRAIPEKLGQIQRETHVAQSLSIESNLEAAEDAHKEPVQNSMYDIEQQVKNHDAKMAMRRMGVAAPTPLTLTYVVTHYIKRLAPIALLFGALTAGSYFLYRRYWSVAIPETGEEDGEEELVLQ